MFGWVHDRRTKIGLLLVWSCMVAANCAPPPGVDNDNDNDNTVGVARWQLVLSELPGALLSASGGSPTDVIAVGSDGEDGEGPLVLRYDGVRWTRIASGAANNIWWVNERPVEGDFYMSGEQGLIMRYSPATGEFEQFETPGTERLFGIWGMESDNLLAVGGAEPPDSLVTGTIWHFDGLTWSRVDTSNLREGGIPTMFKVWGSGADRIYAVGFDGVIYNFNGTEWVDVPSPTTRRLLSVHGSDDLIVAVGGANTGVIAESVAGADFSDVTPSGLFQMTGLFVPPAGDAVAAGNSGSVAFRRAAGWQIVNTGLGLDITLGFHGAWVDSEGGIWLTGGDLLALDRGLLVYFGTRDVGTELVNE